MASSSELRSRSEITDVARGLQPILRDHAEFGDTHRRAADEVIGALQDAGMFRLFTPHRFGGLQTDLVTVQEVTAALGEADGSAAWLVGVAASTSFLIAHGSAELQEDVFADLNARIAGGGAGTGTGRPTAGGHLVSGRWSYASGAPHASWAGIVVTLTDEDGSRSTPAFAIVPMAEVHVADTWHTSGLRGTGSNTVIAEDVFVPAHRLIAMDAFGDEAQSKLDPVYRLPFRSVGECTLIGPMLGVASAALKFVVESAAHKKIPHTVFDTQSKSVGVQLQIADAALRLQTAQLHVRSVAETLTEHALDGSPPDWTAQARAQAQNCHAMHEILTAVNILVDVHGSGGLAEANPLRRMAGDVAMGARHAGFNATVAKELFGKAILGVVDPIFEGIIGRPRADTSS